MATHEPFFSAVEVPIENIDSIILVDQFLFYLESITTMPRSGFSLAEPTIERGPPNAVVYDLAKPDEVTITLPVGSTWSSGLHWHENHVEYLRVVKGSVRVTLGSQERIVAAGDDGTEVRVDRNVWHEWRRAEQDGGEDVVVVERTDPEDGEKAVFFWNLNGCILHAQSLSCPPYMSRRLHGLLVDLWVTLSLFSIFRELDNFPVLVNVVHAFSVRGFQFPEGSPGHILLLGMERFISHMTLFVLSWVAWAFGIGPVRSGFTPDKVRDRWMLGRGKGKWKRC